MVATLRKHYRAFFTPGFKGTEDLSDVLTKLDEWNLSENTLVIFLGDNGTCQRRLFDGGMRGAKGTPEEMGHQHGVLMKDEIHRLVEQILFGVGVGTSFEKGTWVFGEIEGAQKRLNPFMDETVKEFSSLDGAFVIRGDGVVRSAGSLIQAADVDHPLPSGLGSRHAAAAAISLATDCVAEARRTLSMPADAAGTEIPASRPMMVTTTSISIRVKAPMDWRGM